MHSPIASSSNISRRPLILLLVLAMFSWTIFAGKAKNPYKGSSSQPGAKKKDVLFTTEKKHPDKAERKAALEDLRIPKDQRKNYEADYRVPISLGGSNAYANIEVLSKPQAELKKKVQKDLEAKVKRAEISLDEAQLRIFNWQNEPLGKGKTGN